MGDSGGMIEGRLAELGIRLPPVPQAGGSYLPAVVSGDLLFVSGAVGTVVDDDGRQSLPIAGKVGIDVDVEAARASARLAALNLLAQAKQVVGDLDRIARIVKLSGYVHAGAGFRRAPEVVDGASQLLLEIFGEERGSHARISLYQHEMTLGAPVELDLIAELDRKSQDPTEIYRF